MKPPLISVLPRPPHPTRDGLAIRNYHLLAALADAFAVRAFALRAPHLPDGVYPEGIGVTEVPQAPRTRRRLASALESALTGGAYSPALYRSAALSDELSRAVASIPPAWVVAHAYHVGPAALATGRPAWVDFHNLDSQIWKRMGERARSAPARVFARWQAPRVERFEAGLLARAAGVSCVSGLDRAEMLRVAPGSDPAVVPNGVDLRRYVFRGAAAAGTRGPIVFVGDLGWPPNAEGLAWFAERVWPLVQTSGLHVEVLGRGAPRSLVRAAPGWTFLGEGGDTRPVWTRASVAIVPLLAGGGTRLKILEAAASGVPVVSTSVGAEGLGFRDGSEILLRDDPAAFADAVLRVAGDGAFATSLSRAARDLVEREYDWRAIGGRLASLLSERRAS